MANMLKMMQQVKQVKKMQKELARKEVTVSSNDGKVSVVARGDMSIRSITIDPSALSGMDAERLGKLLTSTVNSALDSSKKAAAADMAKLTGGMGLDGLLGG